jgi:hypothetical protein
MAAPPLAPLPQPVGQAAAAREHAQRPAEDAQVVSDDAPAIARLQVADVVEVTRRVSGIHRALRELCRTRQTCDDLVPVREPGAHLLLDELRRPRARADEAHVSADDVQELG